MVGNQDIKEMDEETITWLREGGRELINKTIEKTKEEIGHFVDFSLDIVLPTDRFISIKHKDGGGMICSIKDDISALELKQELKRLRQENPERIITEETGKKAWVLKDNQVFSDMNWHTNEESFKKILHAINELFRTQPKAL